MIEETNCRICRGDLKIVLDLGNIYPSGFVKEQPSEDNKAPLVLTECTNCGLVQLKHTVDLDLMYRQYWYSSSLNKSMVSSLKDIICDIENRIILKEGDIVLDIGCNDGTMLEMYSQPGLLRVGFDPSLNLERKEFPLFLFENNYFTYKSFNEGMGDTVGAKVITAVAMFYDLPNPNKFVEDVVHTLHEDGIFVIQLTDLVSMFKATAFDNICHEHLEYYRLEDIVNLLEKYNLDVIDVSYNLVNGGSVRVTTCHKNRYNKEPSVKLSLENERTFLKSYTMDDFKTKIEKTKYQLRTFLRWARYNKYKVFLMGASTKGNTLLQICNITNDDIPFAAEVNKDKFDLKTVGSNITIISEDDALARHPDYFIVPVWHFKNTLLKNPKIIDYQKSGGKLVFPLPDFDIV